MIELSKHYITVHSRHAVSEDFDPKVLEGRKLVTKRQSGFLDFDSSAPLLIEGLSSVWRLRSFASIVYAEDQSHRAYDDCYHIVPENEKPVRMDLPFNGRLVTLTDGQVAGVLIGGYMTDSQKSARELIFTAADTVTGGTAEHIREALKGTFNTEALKDKPIGLLSRKMEYFALEGDLHKPRFLYTSTTNRFNAIAIDKRPYNEAIELKSYKKGPGTPYKDDPTRLFTSKKDIGRLVYGWDNMGERNDPSKAVVIGVVAGMEQHANQSHRRIYQTTYCAAAPDLLVP